MLVSFQLVLEETIRVRITCVTQMQQDAGHAVDARGILLCAFSPATMQLAFKFVPTREQFVASLDTSEHDNLDQQVKAFVEAFGPLLKEIHEFMVSNRPNLEMENSSK